MNLSIVIFASLALLIACPILLTYAVYSLAAIYQNRQFGRLNSLFLNSFIFGLPASPVLGAVLLWLAWFNHSSGYAYWWVSLPAAILAVYFAYVAMLTRFVPAIAPDAVDA